jgi:iron complex outermembrane receptor protein
VSAAGYLLPPPPPHFSSHTLKFGSISIAFATALTAFSAQAQTSTTLDEVVVSADAPPPSSTILPEKYAGGQTAKGARMGILGNMDLVDAPFSASAYTDQLIEEQQAQVLSDVLLNDASVHKVMSGNYGYELLHIRGFLTSQGDIAFNGLYGIAPYSRVPVEMLERVEIIKGPNALLNGMSPSGAVGGTINVVPKRAGETPLKHVTAQVQSDSQLGVKTDLAQRFGPDKAFGIRFNGSVTSGDTASDNIRNRRALGALAIDHRTDTTRASLDIYANRDKIEGGVGAFAAFRGLTSLPKAPENSRNYFRGAWQDMRNQGFVLSGELDISPDLTAYAAIGARDYKYDGHYSSRITLNAVGGYNGQAYLTDGDNKAWSAEAGLRGQFYTGSVKHVWGLGANSIRTRNDFRQWYSLAFPGTLDEPSPINPGVQDTSYGYLTKVRLNSIALTDSISFAKDRFRVLLGARHQQVRSDSENSLFFRNVFMGASCTRYDKSAVTPMLGVIARPLADRKLSVYANYIEGLSEGGSVTDTTAENYGEVFAPFKTKQIEAGIKHDSGRWSNTLAVYEIRRPSLVSHETSVGTLRYSDDGRLHVRGVEWTTSGEAIDGLRLLGGITYSQGKYVRDQSNQGKETAATPKWRVNLAADWDIPGIHGLAANLRMIHSSWQWADSANTLKVPSWTRWDAGLHYAARIAEQKVTWWLTVENLTDRDYWDCSFRTNLLSLSAPRTVLLSATVDF